MPLVDGACQAPVAALTQGVARNATLAQVPAPVAPTLPVVRTSAAPCCWLSQTVLLAEPEAIDTIAQAVSKIQRARR